MGITGKAYFEGSGDSSNTTSTGQQSYTAQVFWSGSAAKLYLRQHKNNVSSFVKSDIPVTWANGNTLRMEFSRERHLHLSEWCRSYWDAIHHSSP